MVETILEWLRPLFAGALGYAVMGTFVFLDRGAFVGLVAPGDLILALGGVYAGRGELEVLLVVVVGTAAGLAGENVSYWLGRRYGRSILKHIPFGNRIDPYLERSEDYFREHGRRAVFIGRYISVVGTFLPFTAGVSRMSYGRFIAADVAAVALWAGAVTALGYFLSARVDLIDKALSRFGWGLLILAALYFGWKKRASIRARLQSTRS
jgi:membrane protein DedA with SNARE-associated domain